MALAKGFSTIEAAAEAAVRPIVEGHGFSLWDVWFAKEGAKWYLRIFIDKPHGVSIDDCESIDGEINSIIDEQYFIDKIDYLEIGSAGLERSVRRLAQLEQSIGKKVRVKTYKLCDGAVQGLQVRSFGIRRRKDHADRRFRGDFASRRRYLGNEL